MALILPNRFYRQPTSNLIDAGNPITKGLNAGYLASTKSFFGSASAPQKTPNNTYRYDNRFGVGTVGNVNSTFLETVRAPVGANSDITLLSVFIPSSSTTEYFPGHIGQTNGAMSFGISTGNSVTNVLRGRMYLSGTRYFGGGTTITDFNKPIVAVTRQKYNVEQALFVNGVKDPTTTAFTGGSFAAGFIGVSGAGAGQTQFLIATWARALSDAEIWELAQDPYQIFHRPNRRIWVDIPAGGAYNITSAPAAFSLTGNAAGLNVSRKATLTAGSFALTGNAAGLKASRKLTSATATYALTCNAVTLVYYGSSRVLTVATGAFSLTGNSVGFKAARKLTSASRTFALTGNSAGLKASRKLTSATAAYALTCNPVAFTYGSGVRRIVVETGNFILTGLPAILSLVGYARAPSGGGYSPKSANIQTRPDAKQFNKR